MARISRKNPPAQVQSKRNVYNAGAYVRLSEEDRKVKGDSLASQQAIINAFIEDSLDIELIETYIDDGLTGQNSARPALQRMKSDMKSGKINCCISKDLSRLARNSIDACILIQQFFPENGVRYISATEGIDTNNCKGDELFIDILNIANEAVAIEIGRKISQTKQMNIKNGCFVGRIPPYGYLKSKDDKHKLVPDDYAAPIVLNLFQMVADGRSVIEIQKWLIAENILPPKRYFNTLGLTTEKEASGHIHWNKGVLYSILHNEIYCGDMIQGKGRTHRYERRSIPKSDWVITENTHEAIISRELFDATQKNWASADKHKKRSNAKKSDNIFLRKIFCGHCGYTMRRDKSSKTQFNFLCCTRQNYGADDCILVSINEDELKGKLMADIKKEAVAICSAETLELVYKVDNAEKEKLQDVLDGIEGIEDFCMTLNQNFINGAMTGVEYKKKCEYYDKELEDLRERKRNLMINIHRRKIHSAARLKAIKSYKAVRRIADINSEILNALVEKIHVYEDKSIKVIYKFRDEAEDNGSAL